VPVWQLALAIGLVCASAAGAVWMAGRTFRLGMLRYGQRLSWKEIFNRGGVK
jgi:ABC-2 type transport system permease protein